MGRNRRQKTKRLSRSSLEPGRDARLRRSARQVAAGRLRRALAGYLGLAAERPHNLAARNRAGDVLVRAGQIARGVSLFAAVAEEYEQAGFEAKAAALRRKILRVAPDDVAARRAIVRWLHDQGLEADACSVASAQCCGPRAQSRS